MTSGALATGRRAFTLIEVIAATFVVAVLAAVTVPSLIGFLDNQRVQNTAAVFANLQTAITNTTSGFNAKIGNSPGKLSQLTASIAATSALYRNACGGTAISTTNSFTATQVTAWNAAGPFYNGVSIVGTANAGGIQTPMGMIADSIARTPNPSATGQANYIQLRLVSTTVEDAKALDLYVDGVAGSGVGQVLWGTTSGSTFTAGSIAADGTVEIRYQISTFTNKC